MKRMLAAVVTLAVLAAGTGFAYEEKDKDQEINVDLFLRELSRSLEEQNAASVGDLSLGDVQELAADISVRIQEQQFIRKTIRASFFHPGVGHWMNDEKGTGALLMGANIAIIAGTVVGAYFLLPDEIQFKNLNYLDDSFGEIETAWKSTNLTDYAPAAGVVLGGVILKGILGAIAAQSAGDLAQARVERGEVTFEPFANADSLSLGFEWKR